MRKGLILQDVKQASVRGGSKKLLEKRGILAAALLVQELVYKRNGHIPLDQSNHPSKLIFSLKTGDKKVISWP